MDKGTKLHRLYGRDGAKLSAGILRCRVQPKSLRESVSGSCPEGLSGSERPATEPFNTDPLCVFEGSQFRICSSEELCCVYSTANISVQQVSTNFNTSAPKADKSIF